MNSDELRDNWAITRRSLTAARNLLPASPVENWKAGATVGWYDEMMSHNELELAMEALAALGEINAGSAPFWQELIAAAESMELQKSAASYRQR